MPSTTARLLIACPDTRGIVAEVASFVRTHGGNLLDSDQHTDAEHGEWFGYLHRDGSVSSTLKGNLWKGPFHLPRMQLVCWQLLEDNYATDDVCPQGAGVPFNIDAHLNGAYIALGLLYGEGDFEKTMRISTRAGQDSDCNPASAVGVLGVVLGYGRIPDRFKSGIADIAAEKFAYTDYSFEDIVERNMAKVLEAVTRNGGSVEGDAVSVPHGQHQ